MKIQNMPIESAVGGVLIHNISDGQGHKALNKGHRLVASDVEKLHALGKTHVIVGMFDEGDVSENDAASRAANAIVGENLSPTAIGTGRINIFASLRGVFQVNAAALDQVNSLPGITLATIPSNTVVEPKKMVATIKTIGLAVLETTLNELERIARNSSNVIGVRALKPARVAVILTGSAEARERVQKGLVPPIQGRVEDLGASVISMEYVEHAETPIADAIVRAQAARAYCVILAGETSIMDASDVTPNGIVQAGGEIEVYGAPVEPGNLLLLAYAGATPIIGAPGCVKSRDINVVDLILPRLLAGEHLRKKDIVALANGGLLI